MNPSCGRCGKIVYPTEKVNCLDKFWHKACFHCEVCHMTLNMKNYKGYEKKPYCNAHYPKTSFTTVADTPENLRLKQQSEMQSQVRYKEEFEKNKGKGFSVVSDTPELQRIRKTQDQISNIKYHEDFEKSRMGGPLEGGEERRNSEDGAVFRRPQEPQHPPQPSTPAYQQSPQSYSFTQPAAAPAPTPAPAPAPARAAAPSSGVRYRAVYDYSAADEDEISFLDGDVILNVQVIDDGWMYGTVERTGDTGMLPANYVETM
ncbi:LIM and SH3 domain protein 1-like [Acipenser ruthenus]|uniref:LIM and SH3 domain protein 1-like n=1 Tax=Acipenser ruthenus TaxID=7906 RepID=UPI001560B4E1|nr:LIM and SH3 domain protein 1-like [Acipenser ruthenus]